MVFARTTITECLICSGRKKRPGVRVKVNEGDLDYCEGCIDRLYAVLTAPKAREPDAPRPLSVIALEIRKDWKRLQSHADSYTSAMLGMNDIEERAANGDSGKVVVRGFLKNASLWKGPVARRVKRELKELIT